MRDHDATPPTTPDGATSAAPRRDRAGRRRRTLLSLALAGGIALGGAGIAQAASNAEQPSPTSTSSSTTSSSASTAPAAPGGHKAASGETKGPAGAAKTAPGAENGAAKTAPAPAGGDGQRPTPPAPPTGGPQAPGGPGAPGTASGQDGEGIVSAVDASSLTLSDQSGEQRTYTLDDSTTVHQGPGRGQDAAGSLSVSDLAVGQRMHVSATDSASGGGQVTASDIDVHPAHIDGVITATTGATLTVSDHDGFTRTITTDAETSYGRDSQGSASEITTGTPVRAQGTVASDGTTLQASSVEVATGPAGGPGGPGGHGPGKGAAPGGPAQGGPGAPGQDTPAAPGTTTPSQDDGASSGS